jgi:hypothetical protein
MRKIAVFIALCCAHVIGLASDWNFIVSDQKKALLMDFDSVLRSGKYQKAWVKTIYFQPQEMEVNPKKSYQTEIGVYYFNCNDRTFFVPQGSFFGGLGTIGNPVYSWSIQLSDAQFIEIPPDSMGGILLRFACTTATERSMIKKINLDTNTLLIKAFENAKEHSEK